MDDVDEFSASTVITWLMYTRETLRQLIYNVRTYDVDEFLVSSLDVSRSFS